MNIEQLYEYCRTRIGAMEDQPFGDQVLVFKVGGKMFILFNLDRLPLSINLKCDPARAQELRATYEAVGPGYHMNKKHWNTVLPNLDLPDDELFALIDHSYDLVVASLKKADRAALGLEEKEPP